MPQTMTTSPSSRDRANAIRFLSIDAVQKANSGHPGMPMGMADVAEVLWHQFLKHNPTNPRWINRDRFVLSNGHGSMLLYALLHLTGYELSIEDIKQFRQLHSKTPGHPEYGETPGVETTTGPLGQGLGNAVGMAIAEKHLAAQFNQPQFPIIDHYTYCFVGDGCLMEGLSHEVASLAGVLQLGKLIVFYDDNHISIDGKTDGWFRDQTPLRFEAYGWHVIKNMDGQDHVQIRQAIREAQSETNRPSLICCKTIIGWGSPNLAGNAATHGASLGEQEIAAVRAQLHWPHPPFIIPETLYQSWDARTKGMQHEKTWLDLLEKYTQHYPDLSSELTRRINGQLPHQWPQIVEQLLTDIQTKPAAMATRKASLLCLNHYATQLPEIMGGSADLTESNCTLWKEAAPFSPTHPEDRYIHYGVREFGMSTIMTGMALHGGIIPFGGTFLTFSDYARNAIRLAAMMKQRVIFVYTHDSIGLGEDGPTHQPIEQLPSLRMIPGLAVWRPCDAVETAIAWQAAITTHGPTCLLFSRQTLPFQPHSAQHISLIKRGGYILEDINNQTPTILLLASGSEVALARLAAEQLAKEKVYARIVSIPSMGVFLSQDKGYQQQVLPAHIKVRIAIEAAVGIDWYPLVGAEGKIIGLNRFGASAPEKEVFKACGLTAEHIVSMAKQMIGASHDYSRCN